MDSNDNSVKPRTCSLVPFNRFLSDLGKSPVTGWRMRQAGLINTVNISGKIYVAEQEIRRFEERAAAGEFAKVSHAPGRKKEVVS
jgi:hypothetical protein